MLAAQVPFKSTETINTITKKAIRLTFLKWQSISKAAALRRGRGEREKDLETQRIWEDWDSGRRCSRWSLTVAKKLLRCHRKSKYQITAESCPTRHSAALFSNRTNVFILQLIPVLSIYYLFLIVVKKPWMQLRTCPASLFCFLGYECEKTAVSAEFHRQ